MIKAVIVGINEYSYYPGQNLSGCVNDAEDVINYLTGSRSVAPGDIVPLYDQRATKAAITSALRDMVATSTPGDHLLFHFSGHGTQVAAQGVDEADGLDEVLCPTDFNFDDRSSAITDDELAAVLSSVPVGVALTVLVDACHSGDISRQFAARPTDRPRCLRPPRDVARGLEARRARKKRRSLERVRGATISACASSETAIDTSFGGKANGAFTYYWLKAVAATPEASLQQLVQSTGGSLAGYSMHPELAGPVELQASQLLCSPAPLLRALGVEGAARSLVLFDQTWSSSVFGLGISFELRIVRADGGFTFMLTPSVAGFRTTLPVKVGGDVSIPLSVPIVGQLVVDIERWALSGSMLSFDLKIRVVPAIAFFPSITIVTQHVDLPLQSSDRALAPAPQSAAELYAMIQLLGGAGSKDPRYSGPNLREITSADNTPFVAAQGSFGWGPNWREDRPIMVGSLPHNQIRNGEPVLFGQQGAGNVYFVRWLNDDPTDGSFIAHIGNNFFGGWGSISYQVMATYGNVDIVLRSMEQRDAHQPLALPPSAPAKLAPRSAEAAEQNGSTSRSMLEAFPAGARSPS